MTAFGGNYILYIYDSPSITERHQGFLSASFKQLNVIASFPAHSSLAVQNSRRRPGPFYHVMHAQLFTSHK